MALATVTTTFDLADYFGTDFDARRGKAWATTNIDNDTVHDTSTGETRIGGGYATIASDGTGSFTHWAPGADGNPTSWQTTYHFDVPDRTAPKGRRTESFGPFTVTTSGELTALVEEQEIPPTYLSTVTAALDAHAATLETTLDGYVDDAEAARDLAEQYRDEAQDISGIATPDALVATLVPTTSGSATSTALAASFAGGQTRAGAGSYTTGNVVILGKNAYAPGGIATAAVFGGATNYENVIGGNLANVNTSTSNLTGAPTLVAPNGNWNFIGGGYDTVVNGWACFVTGNHIKVATDVNHVTVAGGSLHSLNANGNYAAIGGGTGHAVDGEYCTVAGGRSNSVGGSITPYASIGGGQMNIATGGYSTVAGGKSGTASADNAAVGGGNTNTASGNSSTVSGGLTNAASGIGASVPGGRDLTASGDYSVAMGRYSSATNTYAIAAGQGGKAERLTEFAVGNRFATTGDAQASLIVLKRLSTDATTGALSDGATAAPTMTAGSSVAFQGLIVARRTDVEGDNAAFKVEGLMVRQTSGNSFIGTPVVTTIAASTGASTWTVAVSPSSGRLAINVTGEASKTIRWVCRLETVQVTA